jgi:hypothetical protein
VGHLAHVLLLFGEGEINHRRSSVHWPGLAVLTLITC